MPVSTFAPFCAQHFPAFRRRFCISSNQYSLHKEFVHKLNIGVFPVWRKLQLFVGNRRSGCSVACSALIGTPLEQEDKEGCWDEDKYTRVLCYGSLGVVVGREDTKMYTVLLQRCVSMNSLEEGKRVHALVIRTGTEPDMFMWNTLVNMYAKCGSLAYARHVFDRMTKRNVVSWTAIIAGCSQQGHAEEALELFCEMIRAGIRPNQFSLGSVLRACGILPTLEFGKQIHARVFNTGFLCDVFVGSALVDMYAKCGSMDHAKQVFDKMPEVNVVSWNAMITGCVQNGLVEEALKLFCQMREMEEKLSKFTLSSILRACTGLGAMEQGKQIHSIMVKIGCQLDAFLGSSLIDMYSKCGSIEDARKVFDKMPEHDVVAWTSLIAGYDQNECEELALELFFQMKLAGVKPNQFTFASILDASSSLAALGEGMKVQADTIKTGFDLDVAVGNAVVTMYVECGSMKDACKMFDKMLKRDTVSWNSMAAGFSQNGDDEETLKLFYQMQWAGVKPNKFTFLGILKACANLVAIKYGEQVHAYITKTGFELDALVGSALVDMYAKCGSLEDAHRAFDEMPERDPVSWTIIIAAYAHNGYGEESLKRFSLMQHGGVSANEFTFASVLRACASIAAIEQGKQIHVGIIKTGFEMDVCVGSALVAMYAKCGSIEDASKMFVNIPEQDLVSWNTMIAGYAQHGHGKQALQLFMDMQQAGMKPDRITFVGVLSACSHVGLVDEGHQYFASLSQDYGITPTMEHYACMVHLLGRAGHLDQVEDFINKMPFKPDALVWQTLLSACRIHGNIELGECAAEHMFELEPQNDSTYILLSNIYAAACRWDDVAKVRKMMGDRGVKKEPGCSWIEIKNTVHAFLMEDSSHPQVNEIYLKLDELTQQIKEAGHVPDSNFVLHDVEHELKEQSPSHHSERRAIAFELICTPAGTPI